MGLQLVTSFMSLFLGLAFTCMRICCFTWVYVQLFNSTFHSFRFVCLCGLAYLSRQQLLIKKRRLLFKTCGTFSPEEKLIPVLTVLGPIIGIRARLFMGTNKERIEQLEKGLHRMELSMADRLRQVEENLNRLSDVLLANPGNPILGSITNREGNGGERLVVSSKTAKLEFPRFSGDDPT